MVDEKITLRATLEWQESADLLLGPSREGVMPLAMLQCPLEDDFRSN